MQMTPGFEGFDFKKAINSIKRKVMFAVLCHYEIPEPIVAATSILCNDCKSTVMINASISENSHYNWSAARRRPGSLYFYNANRLPLEKSHSRQQLWNSNTPTGI